MGETLCAANARSDAVGVPGAIKLAPPIVNGVASKPPPFWVTVGERCAVRVNSLRGWFDEQEHKSRVADEAEPVPQ